MKRLLTARLLATGLSLIILLILWTSQITGSRVDGDASHTLQMALHLAHGGVFALKDPEQPSMYREPLPVFVSAGGIVLVDAALGRADHTEYFAGTRAKLLKYQNLIWMLLLSIGMYLSVWSLTASWPCALGAMWVANLGVPMTGYDLTGLGIDTLRTEIPATALLLTASALAAAGFTQASSRQVALGGAAFGLLALVKASFLYVFVGYVAAVCVMGPLRWRSSVGREDALRVLVLIACVAIVCAPWIYRNYVQFGALSIADRGGGVLSIRATKNGMSNEEFRGSFYVWAPLRIQPLVGRMLGFGPEDVKRGGRLQRLNRSYDSDFYAEDKKWELAGRPDKVVSYYRKSRAVHQQLKRELEASGQSGIVRSDAIMQQRAADAIAAHPWRHLVLTVAFLWRGAFVAFPILVLTLGISLWRRQAQLALLVLPAFGMVMFYGLLSHFIPRYGIPAYAIVIVCLATFLCGILREAGSRLAGNGAGRAAWSAARKP